MTKTEENLEGAGGQSIEQVQTETLIPYARNSRTHSDEQVAQIMASIREFGFCNPVLIDAAGTIIAGHGRVMAATRMKLETVPCLRLSHLTEAQRRAYVIADNRIALSSSWDSELLANELSDLHADEFDMALLGFDADELAALLDFEQLPGDENAGEVVEDEVPEPPVDPITKPGNLWILGEHRLLCGDSTNADDVERLMGGERADCVVTDPPYGIGKLMEGGTWAKKQDAQFEMMREWDDTTSQSFFDNVESLGVPSVIWGGNYFQTPPSRCWLAWNKPEFPTMSSVELAWTNLDRNAKRIDCPRTHQVDGAKEHATQKPIAVMAWSLGFVDGSVYDPFLGSGTTLIAAEQLNRKCYGMEISPAYCDVIVKRWENLTGKVATLETNQGE
jgi:DNA modification methylase